MRCCEYGFWSVCPLGSILVTCNALAYLKTCQFQIKFITKDYLQMYKTLQLFTNTFTFNTNFLRASKLLKTNLLVIYSAKLIKTWIKLKLVSCLMFSKVLLLDPKHGMTAWTNFSL
jgi:hypothetical protein